MLPVWASVGEPSDVSINVSINVPVNVPAGAPTETLTGVLAGVPTGVPTEVPTGVPAGVPTKMATGAPTGGPTKTPTQASACAISGSKKAPAPTKTGPVIVATGPVFCSNIYRLENCGFFRALRKPTFLRSTTLASRVTKPAFRSDGRSVSSYSISARVIPCRMAPA
jgi:hypothetical protein